MKIIELQAENVKRLKAVQIEPDGSLQVIGGRNAQGKSSVLDAIWLALGGGKASKDTPLPIRDGEDKARVRLDMGDLVVTRTWTQKGTSLKVENGDGATFKSPQSMLDTLVGQLSFDPLAFTRLSPKEQREALLDLVDLDVDLDALDAQAKEIYAHRTEIGRQGKAIGDVEVDDTLPPREESAQALIQAIQASQDRNHYRQTTAHQISEAIADRDRMQAEIDRLTRALSVRRGEIETLTRTLEQTPVTDLGPLQERLASIEDVNAKIRANNQARERLAEKERLREAYDVLTQRLTELDGQKAAALAAARFPVEGLSFDSSGVLYQGVPLSQASSAEQIRVSLAMGMALNPKLRVLMIKDGSLLDADSMAAIRDQVAEHDYQLLIERVGNADEGAVIIEDGQVQA